MYKYIINVVTSLMNKVFLSIRMKIVIIFALATIIPMGVIGGVSYYNYFYASQETISKSTSQIAEQLNTNLELFFNNINKTLDMSKTELIIRFLDEKDIDKRYNYAKQIGDLFKIYKSAYDFQEVVVDINFIGLSGTGISDRTGVYKSSFILEQSDIFKIAMEDPDKIHIVLDENMNYYRRLPYDNVITIAKIVKRPLTNEIKGMVLVDVDRSAIEDICSNIKLGDTGHFYVVDQDGQYIYNPLETGIRSKKILNLNELNIDIDNKKEGYFIRKIDGEDNFIVYNTLKMPGWIIIGQVRLNEIMSSAYEIRSLTLAIEGIFIIGIVLLFVLISNILTKPLRELRNKMKLAEKGNLNVEARYVNRDEIADLCKGFNVMLIKIKELMKKNLIDQENLKKSEFKVMQAQINPHFLYNTLDAIVWMTEADNKEQVVKTTKDLSDFFKIVLSKGKEWIYIRDEITHVKSYLNIQKVRYRDILEFDIKISPEILDCKILKLTLQPLVENALYHGLKNKRGGGYILITGDISTDGSILVFEVSDNGIGMTEDKLEGLLEEISKPEIDFDTDEGFGLKNVNQRIKLYYGKQYGLLISSEYNKGTSIKVILPANGSNASISAYLE